MKIKEFSTDIGGKTLTATISDLAEKAHGSVIVTYGNTSILATAVMSAEKKEGSNFFPLTVDYEERFYAAGQILGSRFMRREGRPSDEAILSGRVVDRTIRPLFDQRIRNEVQVVITVLSFGEHDPDVLAVNAASLALGMSDIPWRGPVSAVRLGKTSTGDAFEINPTYEMRDGDALLLDATICGKDESINMIEIGAKEVSEETMQGVFEAALSEIEKLQEFQKKIIAEVGKKKRVVHIEEVSEVVKKLFEETTGGKLHATLLSGDGKKYIEELAEEWKKTCAEKLPDENLSLALSYYEEQINEAIHEEAIKNNKRADGRGMDEIRPLYAKAGGIGEKVLHGTGIFYRGVTHVLSVVTLGGPQDAQLLEGMEITGKKRFMHHYNFPPFSSGETGRMGGMNRRMIGHGALAEKALSPVIPPKEIFPYTIRIVSEVMSSNGSTSMASVCASTIALMDAGVPIQKPVAGIAIGLMMEDEKKYKILTDIQGPEDEHGDMDFKVAGTKDGITAVQMDVKVDGVPQEILMGAFGAAKKARLEILDVITKEIAAPRPDIAESAPKILTLKSPVDKIGMIIGPGGKMIHKITEETGAEIDIEEDGTVFITGKGGSAEKARARVAEIIREWKPGDEASGEVVKILDFGAFVKISAYADGLVHISELAPWRVERVNDLLKEGDKVPVVVKEVDAQAGKISLSIKRRDPNFFNDKKKEGGDNDNSRFFKK
ncbi:MAG: polyribonucleotide nucleotidyltransferase [bacterium]|nr:polyribonucleotide nucleotidyltransferase [bacterium]